jgi:hypothetical protein
MSADVVTPAQAPPYLKAGPPFADRLLMCGKCARKLGKDGKAIRKSLKRALKGGAWGKARLEETGCFSLCPKHGQVLAAFRRPRDRRLVVIQPGADIGPALDYLLGVPRVAAGASTDDAE